jgi:SAM-dependent methyltransferase
VEAALFWPADPYRADRSILIAGCGTSQAAHYAARWPQARVVGIDLSEASIASEEELRRKHRLDNLELRRLDVEHVAELGEAFEYVVCTGVLHHLAEPASGFRALRNVLAESGAMHVMVYASYGRAGVYMLQEYCRRLGIGSSEADIRELRESLASLPADHPLVPLLRKSRDFVSDAGVADALLHPRDRAYTVPELMQSLDRAGLVFGRWMRQAPYLPWCGAVASSPHADLIARLSASEQYAAVELFRGTMVRHSFVAYRDDSTAAQRHAIDFGGDAWLRYTPIRLPGTIAVRERLPGNAAAVLINRDHTFTDLYLPIDAWRERVLESVDGKRRIGDMGRAMTDRSRARDFFQELWRWDQVVFGCLVD